MKKYFIALGLASLISSLLIPLETYASVVAGNVRWPMGGVMTQLPERPKFLVIKPPAKILGSKKSKVVILSPGVVTTCGDITSPGTYTLGANVDGGNGTCLNIHDTSDVALACAGHTITAFGWTPLVINKVNHFQVTSCAVKTSADYIEPATIYDSQEGTISESSFAGNAVVTVNTTDLAFTSNIFTSALNMASSTGSQVNNNTFSIAHKNSVSDAGGTALSFMNGANNTAVNNTIDGGSTGDFSDRESIDDGILLGSVTGLADGGESGDVVNNNIIRNVFDCGIETTGTISSTRFTNNKITDTGYCGVGAWYSNNWQNNIVNGNSVNGSPEIFDFYRLTGFVAPGEKFYFQNNTFSNNTFINQKLSSSNPVAKFDTVNTWLTNIPGERQITPADTIVGNNHFSNNDFGITGWAPQFQPGSMAVDDGGNICSITNHGGSLRTDVFPLTCSSGNHIAVTTNAIQNFTATPANGVGITTVTFISTLLYSPACIASTWDFGDGNVESANPSCPQDTAWVDKNGVVQHTNNNPVVPSQVITKQHTYSAPGTYTITYAIGTISTSTQITIGSPTSGKTQRSTAAEIQKMIDALEAGLPHNLPAATLPPPPAPTTGKSCTAAYAASHGSFLPSGDSRWICNNGTWVTTGAAEWWSTRVKPCTAQAGKYALPTSASNPRTPFTNSVDASGNVPASCASATSMTESQLASVLEAIGRMLETLEKGLSGER